MKLGEMQVDYDIEIDYGFFEKRKLIRESKRLLALHPEYKSLKEEKGTEWDFCRSTLIAYLKDCIIKEDPEGKTLYERKRAEDIEHFQNKSYPEKLTNYFFLRKYNDLLRERANPGILEKERQEREKEREQLELQSKLRDRQAQQQLQQDLANGTRVVCPYCKSTNTVRISGISRGISIYALGIASPKLGKQWHCKNCNSNF